MARAPMLRVALPLALGIFIEDRAQLPLDGIAAAAVCLAVALAWLHARRRRLAHAWVLFAVVETGLGVSLGAVGIAQHLFAGVATVGEGAVVFRVAAAPVQVGDACHVPVDIRGTAPGRVSVLAREACAWLPDELRVARLVLERPRPQRNPGGPDARRTARRSGVPGLARLTGGVSARLPGAPSVRARIARLRRRAGDRLDPPDAPSATGAVLRGLVTGSRASIGEALRDVFVRTGTAHLLAISGLHVTWVFWLGQVGAAALLWRSRTPALLRRARRVAVGIGVASAAAYIALAGMGVPGLRAWIMAAVGCLSIALGRPALGWNGLALAAGIIWVAAPDELFRPGFWLSFVAVVGLLVWEPRGTGLRAALHTSVAAGLATAPGLAALGVPLALVAPLANAIAVPWFGGVVLPLGFAAGAFGAAPWIGPALVGVAHGAAWIGIAILERIPAEGAALGLSVGAAASLALAGFALRSLALGRRSRAAALSACAVLAIGPRAGSEPPRDDFAVTILDVGQGDAILLRSVDRRAWLVDAGPAFGGFDAGRSVVAPAARALGVGALEALVLTHADRDHVGGAISVMQRIPVRELWVSRATYDDPALRPIRLEAARRGIRLRLVRRGERFRLDAAAELLVHWPPGDDPSLHRNQASLVLELRVAGRCTLLPGDAPAAVEVALRARLGPCDALKLAHHGSQTSSAPAFVEALRPKVAVVSAARRRRAPLPHPAVRARLEALGAVIYETARVGAVTIHLSPGREVRVSSFICGSAEPRCRAAE